MARQKKKAGVAQLAEHQPSKLRVAGSKPVSRSKKIKGLANYTNPFFLSNKDFAIPCPLAVLTFSCQNIFLAL